MPDAHLSPASATLPPASATLPPAPATLPPALAAPAPSPAFGTALRHALRDGVGRVVLRVEETAPHRRRVARALLQEGALAAGGQVLEGPGGDLLLVGAEARRAERLRALLERLVGPEATLLWSLERDAAALFAYAAGAGAPAPRPARAGPPLAELDAFLDAMPLARVVRRLQGVTRPGAPPAFLRLEPAPATIAEALGPLGQDADLLEHATRRLGARLLAALADLREARALLGEVRAPRLHLPLPPEARPVAGPPVPAGNLVATLPLAAAAEPAALAARQAALAGAGIAVELDGLDAATLALLDLGGLPPTRLRLHWSPPLCAAGPTAQLRRIDPARLALAGAASADARAFAATLGIAHEAPA